VKSPKFQNSTSETMARQQEKKRPITSGGLTQKRGESPTLAESLTDNFRAAGKNNRHKGSSHNSGRPTGLGHAWLGDRVRGL